MRPLEEVRAHVLSSIGLLGTERVDYRLALGRVLGEAIVSTTDVPHFPNSGMDGFAVRSGDVTTPGAVLEVLEDVPAGQVAKQIVGQGQAIKIMTGAPMPGGADTVVRVEETVEQNGSVTIQSIVGAGTSVRPAGGDVRAGDVVFEEGTRLGPMHLGVLATVGSVSPLVYRRPRVAIMSTGDELVPADTVTLAPGMIRDSNRPMLAAMLAADGVDVLDLGTVPDDVELLRATLGRAAVEADAIVTSGGVSMGDYDVTKIVLRDEAGIDFISVAMKPGKPFAFGKLGGTPFFGLPGNPVSVLVSYEQFVRPSLLAMQGARLILRPRVSAIAGEQLTTDIEKTVFVRVHVTLDRGRTVVTQSGGQASNVLSAAAYADAFAVVPRGVADVEPGESVSIDLFRSPETRGLEDDK
ncbi:MAG: gephyrin-like molybdotransferase Glp [Acidimicrobiia bacterium]